MPYTVTNKDFSATNADAAVLAVENRMIVTDAPVFRALASEDVRSALKKRRFLPVGSAEVLEATTPPFKHLIITAAPRWENTRGNEVLILHRCYQNIFRAAERLGCESLATPFLSTFYYGFPKKDAVCAAFTEAAKTGLNVTFIADGEELFRLSTGDLRKPEIQSYIGYYRDHAVFALDNGRFARIDIRPEIRDVTVIPYFEPCYVVGNNPLQEPLAEREISRLIQVYQEWEF